MNKLIGLFAIFRHLNQPIKIDMGSKRQEIKPNKEILVDKYIEEWNKRVSQMNSDLEKDRIDFPNDENINFKWILLNQEILMWISLCCGDNVEYNQVPLDDFNFIVNRRGFTPRITSFLRDILKDIGIGDELSNKGE